MTAIVRRTSYQLLTAGLEKEQALAVLKGETTQDSIRAAGALIDAPGAVSAANIGREPLACVLRVAASPSVDAGALGFVDGALAWESSGATYRLQLAFLAAGSIGIAMACWCSAPPADVAPVAIAAADSVFVYFYRVSTGAVVLDPRVFSAALNVWALRTP